MKYISHKEAVNIISKELDIPPKEVDHYVNSFFKRMIRHMQRQRIIHLEGFGKFILNGRGKRLLTRRKKNENVIVSRKNLLYNDKRNYRDTEA